MEYIIIERNTCEEVVDCVNKMIKKGWKPFGGVSHLAIENNDVHYPAVYHTIAQAMVRE